MFYAFLLLLHDELFAVDDPFVFVGIVDYFIFLHSEVIFSIDPSFTRYCLGIINFDPKKIIMNIPQ